MFYAFSIDLAVTGDIDMNPSYSVKLWQILMWSFRRLSTHIYRIMSFCIHWTLNLKEHVGSIYFKEMLNLQNHPQDLIFLGKPMDLHWMCPVTQQGLTKMDYQMQWQPSSHRNAGPRCQLPTSSYSTVKRFNVASCFCQLSLGNLKGLPHGTLDCNISNSLGDFRMMSAWDPSRLAPGESW